MSEHNASAQPPQPDALAALAADLRALPRFDMGEIETGIGCFPEMVEGPQGNYVRHEDVIALLAKLPA